MQDIKELTLKELGDLLERWGMRRFHAQQVLSWIYQKGAEDFGQMSDLPQGLRQKLKENFYLFGLKLTRVLKSGDGTEKFLFSLKDGNSIEAVAIPTATRVTGCISTQVGCRFRCAFCASGTLGFKRNLTVPEILGQALYLKNHNRTRPLTHLVFMGIGEPLDNYANLLQAIRIINAGWGMNIGARRVTISTCGVIPGIKKLAGENLQIELSVSLHSADDNTRTEIMPVNKIYPLRELVSACKEYARMTKRQITFEYCLMKGLNADLPSAQKLVKILAEVKPCKVNLIPANPIRELKVEPPDKTGILFFRDYLLRHAVNVTLRRPRGEDIQAACGQLRLKYVQRKTI